VRVDPISGLPDLALETQELSAACRCPVLHEILDGGKHKAGGRTLLQCQSDTSKHWGRHSA